MDAAEAVIRANSWRENQKTRPQPDTARAVAIALADRVLQLEEQLRLVRRMALGRQVLIARGNADRGSETGPGFGRRVPAVIEEVLVGDWQVRCKLLVDDPHGVGGPCRAGDSGFWSASQIIID